MVVVAPSLEVVAIPCNLFSKQRLELAGVVLAVALAACTTATQPPSSKQLTGEARAWTGGDAVLKATASDRNTSYLVSSGTIDATGNFSVTLPASVEAPDSLAPLACQESEKGTLEVSPSTLNVSLLETLVVAPTAKDGEPETGELSYADRNLASGDALTRVAWAYAPVAGTVTGACRIDYRNASDDAVFSTETFTFDLTLAAGWNELVVELSTPSNGDLEVTYETRIPPTGLSWRYRAYPPLPNDGPPPPPQAADER